MATEHLRSVCSLCQRGLWLMRFARLCTHEPTLEIDTESGRRATQRSRKPGPSTCCKQPHVRAACSSQASEYASRTTCMFALVVFSRTTYMFQCDMHTGSVESITGVPRALHACATLTNEASNVAWVIGLGQPRRRTNTGVHWEAALKCERQMCTHQQHLTRRHPKAMHTCWHAPARPAEYPMQLLAHHLRAALVVVREGRRHLSELVGNR